MKTTIILIALVLTGCATPPVEPCASVPNFTYYGPDTYGYVAMPMEDFDNLRFGYRKCGGEFDELIKENVIEVEPRDDGKHIT